MLTRRELAGRRFLAAQLGQFAQQLLLLGVQLGRRFDGHVDDEIATDYHTVGDVAYWDDEGYLYICDRKTDMIISGGMNIYPAEIEAALEQHPEIYRRRGVRDPVGRVGRGRARDGGAGARIVAGPR